MGQSTLCICEHTARSHARGDGPCRFCSWCRGFKPKGGELPARPEPAQVAVYVATLDTGGISHSGREFIAVDYSEVNVQQALVAAVKADGWPETLGGAKVFEALNDFYGVRIIGPITIGGGARSDL